MTFMVPEYSRSDFHTGETPNGESVVCPADVWGTAERFATETGCALESVARVTGKVWVRLSAPGYMDATDWSGPYQTEKEARDYIEDTYDVDASTGADRYALITDGDCNVPEYDSTDLCVALYRNPEAIEDSDEIAGPHYGNLASCLAWFQAHKADGASIDLSAYRNADGTLSPLIRETNMQRPGESPGCVDGAPVGEWWFDSTTTR